ncbi:M20 family metallopeptidase [Caloramator sp. E03]|uniref:peptidase dimerization domain-containing protein n=1 Tax=Caloramator sp. E03 TaxID=2576307 RepID=UPI0011102991|nr:peptidase dimerization domain-containing protein [Caloramator sp. E03]QCX33477.1 M20 family metallopeptidase [Caloramator sp. E03]
MENSIRYSIKRIIDCKKEKLEHIVDFMYKNPELPSREEKSFSLLTSILKEEGFNIETDIAGIKHSFKAQYGKNKISVAYICEYDAAKNLGHVFGHNITCAINIGAAIALKEVLDKVGGSVIVIGSPSEMNMSGKIEMMKKGIFNGIDAVICGHAMDKTCESGSSLAMALMDIEFKGKSAHTSINFNEGINALTPGITFLSLIERLKVKYSNSIFINTVIRKAGDDINVIPDECLLTIMVKAVDMNILDIVCKSIEECANFSSSLHSCKSSINYVGEKYMPLKTNEKLSMLVCHNLKECGILEIHGPLNLMASLDLGNISYNIPTVHPYIGISNTPVKYYTKEFCEATITPYAKEQMLKAAAALAITGADIIQKPDILS